MATPKVGTVPARSVVPGCSRFLPPRPVGVPVLEPNASREIPRGMVDSTIKHSGTLLFEWPDTDEPDTTMDVSEEPTGHSAKRKLIPAAIKQ